MRHCVECKKTIGQHFEGKYCYHDQDGYDITHVWRIMTVKEEVIEILSILRGSTPEAIAHALEISGLLSLDLHLEALRRISKALDNPYKGDTTKTCLDLADLAVIKIGIGREKDANNPFTQHWK